MITKLLEKLKGSKDRRDLFVAGQIKTGIPFQIRALRDKKEWTQAQLGEALRMTQTNVSRLESPGYGRLNITTLQRIASTFDVALIVRFVPFSELVRWTDNLSPEVIAPPSFDEEIETLERMAAVTTTVAPPTWSSLVASFQDWETKLPAKADYISIVSYSVRLGTDLVPTYVDDSGDFSSVPNVTEIPQSIEYLKTSTTQFFDGVM